MPQFENKITQPPSVYLRRVYVDTANSSVPNQLANLEVMGAGQMLFGTDSPPLATPLEDAIAAVRNLPISDDDKADPPRERGAALRPRQRRNAVAGVIVASCIQRRLPIRSAPASEREGE